MAFLDLATFEKQEILDYVQAMLTRPMMYAQTPGSLEDQVLLLLGLIWNSAPAAPGAHQVDLFRDKYQKYQRNTLGNGHWTAASVLATKDLEPGMRDDECFEKLAAFMQGFLKYLQENP